MQEGSDNRLKSYDWEKIKELQERRKKFLASQREYRKTVLHEKLGPALQESDREFLARLFEQVEPYDFYSDIFKDNLDIDGDFTEGEYTGIVIEKTHEPVKRRNKKTGVEYDTFKTNNYNITDGLCELMSLIENSDNFCFTSPISYAGKRRIGKNARFLFALAIDLDNLLRDEGTPAGCRDLIWQIWNQELPQPTYIVHSGTGLHLYYLFEDPIPLYAGNVRLLQGLRKKLIKRIWNGYVTESYLQKDIQWESLFQGFRVVGTKTKKGIIEGTEDRCVAFRFATGEPVTIDYLASFVENPAAYKKIKPKAKHTVKEMKEKFPDWYERHFDKNDKPLKNPKRKYWTCKPEMYDWYFNQLERKIEPGHRYHSLMILAAYALKSGISRERFEEDCWSLLEPYERKTDSDKNHFTEYDVRCALSCYNREQLKGVSIDAVNSYTGLNIQKNKRNGRPQIDHLKQIARADQERYDRENGTNWRDGNGRKPKQAIVQEWQKTHPEGRKIDCIRDTGLGKTTVYKWWKES